MAAELAAAERRRLDVPSSDGEVMSLERVGVARFALDGEPCELKLLLAAGLRRRAVVPFADATAGKETYGAGRYLLDTIKGADLGMARRAPRAGLQPRLQPLVLL